MQSKAKTVAEYLNSLPARRQKPMVVLRKVIKNNLPNGFEEVMSGMIVYVVPHSMYPAGYHCNPNQPVPFIGLASQKNYISFYHMGLYKGALLNWFQHEWKVYTKQKLDMGKCCIRFKKPDDIPVDLIASLVTKMTPQEWLALYTKSIAK